MIHDDETLPGEAFDGLFSAYNLLALDAALAAAEEAYRPNNGRKEDFDPVLRDAIVDTCLKMEILRDRLCAKGGQ